MGQKGATVKMGDMEFFLDLVTSLGRGASAGNSSRRSYRQGKEVNRESGGGSAAFPHYLVHEFLFVN
jgi:hypothetical protein